MYYRVAKQVDERDWRWASTVLSSLDTIIRFLRLYRAFPQDRLWVFSSASRECLIEQLVCEKRGWGTYSVTAAQFLRERLIASSDEVTRAAPAQEIRESRNAASYRDVGSSLSSRCDLRPHRVESVYGLDSRRLEVEHGTG